MPIAQRFVPSGKRKSEKRLHSRASRPMRVEWRREVCRGGEEEKGSANLERLCQAVSPNDEPCDHPATVHCATCGRWFCVAHAEDE